ncbi:MAG TPA: hypothetical protein VM534_08685 [Thermoanaerobaculia bacterium]|nr:hypothetical protein [Thermoanaerobaculia bacterium]
MIGEWSWLGIRPRNAIRGITATRAAANPLLLASSVSGGFVNGPSVIRVPEWISSPLGRYYLYFGQHHGKAIRLAHADSLDGPWTIHGQGPLTLDQTPLFRKSIAAPDVHLDAERGELRMYFRGDGSSSVARSRDGLSFVPAGEIVSRSYLRVFYWRGAYYGICKDGNSGWGMLLRSPTGVDAFERRGRFIRGMRHAAVLLRGERLIVFYSRVGDAPERIVAATVDLHRDWKRWTASGAVDVLAPETGYEGIEFPNEPSRYGSASDVRQLRDPFVFDDEGRLVLFYSIAGEAGIAMADLTLELD